MRMALEEEAGYPADPDDRTTIYDTDIDWGAEIARDDQEIEDELYAFAWAQLIERAPQWRRLSDG